jgi:energy-coupling factor transport system permease protein
MSSQTQVPQSRRQPRVAVLADRPLGHWRTIDLVTAALIAVAMGVVFWAWGLAYNIPAAVLKGFAAPFTGLLGGPWLLAGVLGALIIRRPGAALFAEMLAATVSALIGTEWGWLVLVSGLLQGLGVEIAVALLAYRRFGVLVAVLGGGLAGLIAGVYEVFYYYSGVDSQWQLLYTASFAVSGALVAGLGGWALTRALARTGALGSLPPGQEAARESAV